MSTGLRGLDGEYIHAGTSRYEAARAIENMRLVQSPHAIIRCRSVEDVRLALAHARERALPVCVRSGGHSAAGWSSIDGGLVIDLTLMRDVEVDPIYRSARIGGGALATDLVTAAGQHGLAPVTGIHSTVGLSGLLLGLGEGYLTGRYGFGVDNVTSVELVTADGTVLALSAESQPDLFWAVRGAGANFGVVTSMTLKLHPLPPVTLGGTVTFGGAAIANAVDYVWDLMHRGSLDSWPSTCFTLDDDGAPRVAVTLGHVGDVDEGRDELARLRGVGTPLADTTSLMSYRELIAAGGAVSEQTLRPRAVWGVYRFPFDGDPDRQKRLILSQQAKLLRSPATYISLWRTPALADGPVPSSAPRHAGITVFVRSMWDDPEDDEVNLDWFTRTVEAFEESDAVAPAANTINHVSQLDRVNLEQVYGQAVFDRLSALKAQFDPGNVFSSNANIAPRRSS